MNWTTGELQWTTPQARAGMTDSVVMTPTAKVFTSVVYALVLVSGVIGNILVIWVIRILRNRTCIQRPVMCHMVSMACSDLLILTICLPIELYSIIWCPYPWPAGRLGCKGFYLLWEICSYATVLNILALSLERYMAICHPLHVKVMSGSRTKRLIGLIWVTAAISALPVTFAIGLEDAWGPFRPYKESRPPLYICTNLSGRKVLFQAIIYTSFSLYLAVLLVVGITCGQMIKTLNDRPVPSSLERTKSTSKVLPRYREIRRQNIVMLGCVVGALAICWVPFQARRLMAVTHSKTQWTEEYYRSYLIMQPITNTFYYLSSAINPLLYNISAKQFRRVFVQVLRGHSPHSSVPPESDMNSQSDLQKDTSFNREPSPHNTDTTEKESWKGRGKGTLLSCHGR
ncbi:G-protein coupled receptor 39-like [Callorhinchus milii]|uniref:G-protein coupled receptor 39-like n=1 Tax=Callorhinchus milii TaxID=7868 RepID=A0A4W3JXW4_CALMI|nr:G-protein coupled receptor 39-like [Callorhinchus milii]|eukprot:gi/632972196/ref/XP_007902541.1/ PREDICTED: G-protein coupled receptor 39-like [Callorhinchus milii]